MGDVEIPVEPTSAMRCPALTVCPALTYLSPSMTCPYTLETVFPPIVCRRTTHCPNPLTLPARRTVPSAIALIRVPEAAPRSCPRCHVDALATGMQRGP